MRFFCIHKASLRSGNRDFRVGIFSVGAAAGHPIAQKLKQLHDANRLGMIVESVEIERRFYGQGTEILESVYFPREPLAEGTPDCTKAETIA